MYAKNFTHPWYVRGAMNCATTNGQFVKGYVILYKWYNILTNSDIPTTDGPLTDNTLITPSSNEISSVGEKKTVTVNLDGKEYQIPAISNLPTISPHGFGEFPEVPKDYNDIIVGEVSNPDFLLVGASFARDIRTHSRERKLAPTECPMPQIQTLIWC